LIQVSGGVVLLAVIAVAIVAQYFQQAANAGAGVANYAASQSKAPTGSTANNHDERRPLGTWERTVGPVHITLTFTPDHMEGVINLKGEKEAGKKLAYDFRADYSVSRDYALYGIVTSAGIAAKAKVNAEDLMEAEAMLATLLLDQPFSLRFRVDDDVLTVKDIRFNPKSDGKGGDSLGNAMSMGVGRYSRKVAATPTPRTP
jgi:hypothetical protein